MYGIGYHGQICYGRNASLNGQPALPTLNTKMDGEISVEAQFLQADELVRNGQYAEATTIYMALAGASEHSVMKKFITMLSDDCSDSDRQAVREFCHEMDSQQRPGASMLLGYWHISSAQGNRDSYQLAVQYFIKARSYEIKAAVKMLFKIGEVLMDGRDLRGRPMQPDFEMAFNCFDKVLDQQNQDNDWKPKATEELVKLGLSMKPGQGVVENDIAAFNCFKAAYEKGWSVDAAYQLGLMYFHGTGIESDFLRAFLFFQHVLDQEDPEHDSVKQEAITQLVELGLSWKKKSAVQNHEAAFACFQLAYENGSTDAVSQLGWMYYDGLGTQQDFSQAFKYFMLAYETGAKNTGTENGSRAVAHPSRPMHSNNTDLRQNLLMIFICFEKVMDPRNVFLRHEKIKEMALADLVEFGLRIKADQRHQDTAAVFKCFQAACNQGSMRAAIELGWMYLNGVGVTRDTHAAFACFKFASDKGDQDATYQAGLMYLDGIGTAQDPTAAFKCFKKVRSAEAKNLLAEMYLHGLGTKRKNLEMAIKLYAELVMQGSSQAYLQLIKIVKKTLSDTETSVARVNMMTLYLKRLNSPRTNQWIEQKMVNDLIERCENWSLIHSSDDSSTALMDTNTGITRKTSNPYQEDEPEPSRKKARLAQVNV